MASRSGSRRKLDKTRSDDAGHIKQAIAGSDRATAKAGSRVAKAPQDDELYRQLAESSVDFIYVIDRDFRVKYLNRSGAASLRMSQGDAVGKHLTDLFPRGTAENMMRSLSRVFESGKPVSKVMTHHFFSGDFHIHVSLNPIFDGDGRVDSVMGVSRDINELKEAEKAIRNSEEKFRALSESAPVAICILQDGGIKYANPAMEAISGYSQDELRSINFLDMIHPETRNLIEKRYVEWVTGIDGEFRSRLMGVRKDGRVCWIDLSRKTIDYQGRPALLLTGIDITERKQAEEELKAAKQQAELYLDLMGHDINNMHQVALGYLELARDPPAGCQQAELLDKSVEVLQRSTRLIGNVKKLQKQREGIFQTQDLDICKILSDIRSEYGRVPGKTIRLNLNGHGRCLVQANELLYDVFSNLVSNAVKHTGGATKITVDLDAIEDAGKHFYRVAVEDDGPGVPDSYKDIIFNRIHIGSARGTGLGLYIVKTLVNSYDGRVWVEDRVPGDYTRGVRFVVLLPAVE